MAGRGSAPGERRGGRQKGVPNKRTLEALEQQAIEVHSGKKLAKDVLDECMMLCAGMAAAYQPAPPNSATRNQYEDEAKFWKCMEMTRDFAIALAKYQSPTFKAIVGQFQIPTPLVKTDEKPLKATNVTMIDDPEALQRVYRLRIGRVG